MPNPTDLFKQYKSKPSITIPDAPDGTRIVVLSDLQIPFQDDELMDVIINELIPWFKPKKPGEYHLFINGDLVDLYTISRFSTNPTATFTVDEEVEATVAYLKRLKAKFTHRHFIFGNHEERWMKYIWDEASKFAKYIPPLDEVLELKKLGYDWVPYQKHFEFLGFILTHGNSVVKYAAAQELMLYQRPGTSGHTNRPQAIMLASAAGDDPITWYSTGMLCRTDIGDFIPAFRRTQSWQQCFGIGEVQDGVLHYELVRVHNNAFRAAGRVFKVEREA